MSNESSLIGSDPSHTKWCHGQAKLALKRAQDALGRTAWDALGHVVRDALLSAQLVGQVVGQENESAPLWRMQELIQVTMALLGDEECDRY